MATANQNAETATEERQRNSGNWALQALPIVHMTSQPLPNPCCKTQNLKQTVNLVADAAVVVDDLALMRLALRQREDLPRTG